MKKLLIVAILSLTNLGNAYASQCQDKLERDINFRAQSIDRLTAGEMLVYDMPKKCALGKKKGDRTFGCLLTGLFYGFAFLAGPVGIPSAVALASFGHLMDKDIRHNRKQFKADVTLLEHYMNPESKSALRKVRRKFFPPFTKLETVKSIMKELDETGKLCSNGAKIDRQLKITDEGIAYLKERGFVPMDLILNDDMPKEVKDYVISKFLYTTSTTYGEILSKKEIKRAVKEIL